MDQKRSPLRWWPLLIGPAVMVASYVIEHFSPSWWGRVPLERMAMVLTPTALGIALLHGLISRRHLYIVLTALALTVFFREIHWDWTTKAVYVSVGLICVWAYFWRVPINRTLDRYPFVRVWIIATGVMYVLSQAIARRFFRGMIPNEQQIYNNMEEFSELIAHSMLIVLVLIGPWWPESRDRSAVKD